MQAPTSGDSRSPWWSLLAVAIGQFMVVVDVTIVNIALPTMAVDLHATVPDLEWTVIAYSLTMIGLVPTLGRLSDVFGRKRLYIVGLGAFGSASLLAAASGSIPMLIGARVAQAVGGALITSNTLAILSDVFPAGKRGVAMGVQSILISGGAAIGPVLGGFLVTRLSWHAIFWVNVPVAIVGSLLAWRVLPALAPSAEQRHIDWFGAALLLVGLVGVLMAVSRGPEWGWTNGATITAAGIGVVALASFTWWQSRAPAPIVDPALLSIRPFVAGQIAGLLGTMSLVSMVFSLPFYWVALRGQTTEQAGLYMLPLPLSIMLTSPIAGRLSDRIGSRGLTTMGLILAGCAAGLLSRVDASTSVPNVLWRVALIGLGLGSFLAPNNNAIMNAAPARDRGVASGLIALFRFLGQSSGIVLAGTILAHFVTDGSIGTLAHVPRSADAEALARGFHTVCLAVIPVATLGALASLSRGTSAARLQG